MTDTADQTASAPSGYPNPAGGSDDQPEDHAEVEPPSRPDAGGTERAGAHPVRPSGVLPRRILVPLLVVPLLGALLAILATRHGPVIGQDSAAYIGAAQNLLHGRGLTTPFDLSGSALSPAQAFAFHGAVPLVHFPPLYPLILAAVSAIGPSVASGARWLNVVLIAVNLLLFELLVRRRSRSEYLVPVAAAFLLLAGPTVFFHQDLLEIQTAVLSDPLFLSVFLLGVLLTDLFLDHPSRGLYFGIVACVTLAPLIRYVGFSLVAAAAIVILVWSPLTRPRRWGAAAVVVICGLLPSGIWSLITTQVMHGEPVRTFAWHALNRPVQGLLNIASGWLLPASLAEHVRWLLFVLILAFVGVSLMVVRKRGTPEASAELGHIMAIVVFGATYLLGVLFTRALLDATTPLDDRILLPLIPLLYLLVIATLTSVTRDARVGTVVVAGLCILAGLPNVAPALSLANSAPPSYADSAVAKSATMEAIRRLPPDTVIASGVADLVYLDTGRGSIRVPVRVDGDTDRPNRDFTGQLRELAAILAAHHGVLVDIPSAQSDFVTDGATASNLAAVAPVYVLHRFPDGGTFYGVQ
jgi:hypothetical protein